MLKMREVSSAVSSIKLLYMARDFLNKPIKKMYIGAPTLLTLALPILMIINKYTHGIPHMPPIIIS